jgi:hypothetical protein
MLFGWIKLFPWILLPWTLTWTHCFPQSNTCKLFSLCPASVPKWGRAALTTILEGFAMLIRVLTAVIKYQLTKLLLPKITGILGYLLGHCWKPYCSILLVLLQYHPMTSKRFRNLWFTKFHPGFHKWPPESEVQSTEWWQSQIKDSKACHSKKDDTVSQKAILTLFYI